MVRYGSGSKAESARVRMEKSGQSMAWYGACDGSFWRSVYVGGTEALVDQKGFVDSRYRLRRKSCEGNYKE